MNDDKDLDLFVEVAKLLRRFGPETFEKLARNLEGGHLTKELAAVLSRASAISGSVRGQTRERSSGTSFVSTLKDLERSDPQKSQLLLNLYEGLMNKQLLPTMRELAAFASDTGLPVPNANSRAKAIIPLLKSLSQLSEDEIRSKCSRIRLPAAGDRSLEGWSEIILDKTRRSRDSHS